MGTQRQTRVKICGIRLRDDAIAAREAGADFIGFIFARFSKRYIRPEDARIITRDPQIHTHIKTVGIFVDEGAETINAIAEDLALDYVQIYEDDAFAEKINPGVIRAVRVKDNHSIQNARKISVYDYILYDAFVPGYGGEGIGFQWELLKTETRPFFLAGGLSTENVGEAIRITSPCCVDVSSGVEKKPGIKDHARIRQFIDAVRHAS